MSDDRFRRILVAVAILGFDVSGGVSAVILSRPETVVVDPDGFGRLGTVLFETGTFDTVSKGPGYPAFLAALAGLTGAWHMEMIAAAQSLLIAFTVLLTGMLGKQLRLSSSAALLGALGVAVCPTIAWYAPRLFAEILQMTLIVGFAVGFVRVINHGGALATVLTGVVIGLACLVKGIMIVYLPLAFLYLAFRCRATVTGTVVLASALVVIAPWTLRNLERTGEFIPVHTSFGYNMYMGNGFVRNYFEAPGSYTKLWELTEADMPIDPAGAPTILVDDVLLEHALQELIEDPLLLPRKLVTNSIALWYLAGGNGKSVVTAAAQFPILILGLLGIGALLRARRRSGELLVFFVSGIFIAAISVFAFARIASPVLPFLLLGAGHYVSERRVAAR